MWIDGLLGGPVVAQPDVGDVRAGVGWYGLTFVVEAVEWLALWSHFGSFCFAVDRGVMIGECDGVVVFCNSLQLSQTDQKIYSQRQRYLDCPTGSEKHLLLLPETFAFDAAPVKPHPIQSRLRQAIVLQVTVCEKKITVGRGILHAYKAI